MVRSTHGASSTATGCARSAPHAGALYLSDAENEALDGVSKHVNFVMGEFLTWATFMKNEDLRKQATGDQPRSSVAARRVTVGERPGEIAQGHPEAGGAGGEKRPGVVARGLAGGSELLARQRGLVRWPCARHPGTPSVRRPGDVSNRGGPSTRALPLSHSKPAATGASPERLQRYRWLSV